MPLARRKSMSENARQRHLTPLSSQLGQVSHRREKRIALKLTADETVTIIEAAVVGVEETHC